MVSVRSVQGPVSGHCCEGKVFASLKYSLILVAFAGREKDKKERERERERKKTKQ